jgi:hypothetical protein
MTSAPRSQHTPMQLDNSKFSLKKRNKEMARKTSLDREIVGLIRLGLLAWCDVILMHKPYDRRVFKCRNWD